MQNFWAQLAAVEQLSTAGSARLLQLGNNAPHFPQEGIDVQDRLLVRQCYEELSQILQDYFAARGRSFIINGNPGNYLQRDPRVECWSHFFRIVICNP